MVLAVAMAGGAVACNGGDEGATTTTTSTIDVPTTPAPPSTSELSSVTTAPKPGMSADEIAIRNVLDIEAAEFAAAVDPPDPNRPGLLALNTGAARDKRVEVVVMLQNNGEYSRRDGGGPVPHKTDGVEISGDTAAAFECVVDDAVRRKLGTDEVVNETVSSSIRKTTLVREADGQWRISSRENLDSASNRNLCPHVA